MKSVTSLRFYLAAASFCWRCSPSASVSDDIVARVNAKEITAAELEKQYQVASLGATQLPTPEESQALKFQLLTQMINDEILLQMATEGGLNATDAEVETKFTELKSQYTEEKFQEMLNATEDTSPKTSRRTCERP